MDIPNARQFHVPPSHIHDEAASIPLGPLYRQMIAVLRLRKGDAVRLFDGMGNVVEGPIAHVGRDAILVTIEERSAQTRLSSVTLAMGILKNDRMRWVLEKATELGVATIIPLLTERVVKRPSTVPPRWTTICKEAAEQSGHAWLPELHAPMTLREVLALPQLALVCSVSAAEPFERPSTQACAILVGPEGGFTSQELDLAEACGAKLLSLGAHQLRADTAAVVALAAMRP